MALRPDYATLDELKQYLRIPGVYPGSINTEDDTFDDIPLALAITAASRAIEKATNRQFGVLSTATAFIFTAQWYKTQRKHVVEIDDLMTITDLVVKAEGSVYIDYQLLPYNAPSKGEPWTLLKFDRGNTVSLDEGDIEITAKWGWTSVPDTIKNATLLQAARFFKRRDAPFGVAGSPELGSELRLLAKVDPDVAVMVASYTRRWGAM